MQVIHSILYKSIQVKHSRKWSNYRYSKLISQNDVKALQHLKSNFVCFVEKQLRMFRCMFLFLLLSLATTIVLVLLILQELVVVHKIHYIKKMKFSIKYFFSKCDQIRRKLQIWSHLVKKSLMENFIFCAVMIKQHFSKSCCGKDFSKPSSEA